VKNWTLCRITSQTIGGVLLDCFTFSGLELPSHIRDQRTRVKVELLSQCWASASCHCGSPVPRWFIRTRKKVGQIGRNVRFTSLVSIRQTGGMSIISTVLPGRHKAPLFAFPRDSTCLAFFTNSRRFRCRSRLS